MLRNIILTLIFISSYTLSTQAQVRYAIRSSEKEFQGKVSELYTKYKTDGFVTYKGGNLDMERSTEFPIFVELKEGNWYQFVVVGDPEATKFEMKLGLEGVGDFITDKFRPEVTNEFWTQFAFICPRSGRYLLTFYQRGPKKEMLGHVGILQRPARTNNGVYSFKL
ncbi:MAG: hypothetical protein JNJ58_13135 [Chitinophagaceae bacterium]|nr:hypothetical protein [Chitinophagaceae bacterium]